MSPLECRDDRGCHVERLACAYLTAKEAVISSGYAAEIDWQHNLSIESITESAFLRESAWVILSAGMKESVVRSRFPALSNAFFNWLGADRIVHHRRECRCRGLAAFANEKKIDAILGVAERVHALGFPEIRRLVERDGVSYIDELPFMGPATSFHLAKNLGLPVVKPDRHLLRVARCTGYSSPDAMCHAIAQVVGDKVQVVDLVIWRYATIERDYLSLFSET